MLPIFYIDKTETQQFFSDKIIFITGGTGFVGSGLIEKLLRTCPDIKKIYLLIRSKKGKGAEERLNEMYDNAYWQEVKIQFPNFKSKFSLINGDLIEKNLGLSEVDKNIIINEVQIVFHVAATVKFDESLKKAVYINIQATKDVMDLCVQIKNLQSVVHVSTAYSQCILPELEEKIYPPMRDPEEFLKYCENFTAEQLDEMTPSIIKNFPNTYTFTKGLAETIVQKYENKIPITIVRPSIVLGCWKEPVEGWTDNLYGPVGLMVGIGIGLIRVLYMNQQGCSDIVPVDMVVNHIIIAAVDSSKRDIKNQNMQVYNLISSKRNPITWGEFYDWVLKFAHIYPSLRTMWIYVTVRTTHVYVYKIFRYLLHVIPGHLIDMGLKFSGKEPKMIKIYEKIDKLSELLKFFALKQWSFHDDNTLKLFNRLSLKDKHLYCFDIKEVEWDKYLYHTTRIVRTKLLKDPLSTVPQAQRKIKILTAAHYSLIFTILVIFGTIFYYLYQIIF